MRVLGGVITVFLAVAVLWVFHGWADVTNTIEGLLIEPNLKLLVLVESFAVVPVTVAVTVDHFGHLMHGFSGREPPRGSREPGIGAVNALVLTVTVLTSVGVITFTMFAA